MTCATNHPPIEHHEQTCPLCDALWKSDLLRVLVSEMGVSMIATLERGAVILEQCEPAGRDGTRH